MTLINRFAALAVFSLLFLFAAGLAFGQPVVVDPAPPVPVEFETWQQLVAYWLPKVIQGALAVAGTVLAFAIKRGVALLPDLIRGWFDAKRQRDLHSAIMSKVAQLIAEGRWPTAGEIGRDLLAELRDYGNTSVPQAMERYGLELASAKGDKVLKTLATRFGLQLDPLRGTALPMLDTPR